MVDKSTAPYVAMLDPVLSARGFARSGQSWFREDKDGALLVNLQTSWLGPYVNFGVAWRKFGAVSKPDIAECHVWTRLNGLVPDAARAVALTNKASGVSEEDRRRELQDLLAAYVIPWLEGISNFEEAKSFLPRHNKPDWIAIDLRDELAPLWEKRPKE